MRTHDFLLMGLVASRGSQADTMTMNVGQHGISAVELRELADKWALETWTDYDDQAGQTALTELQGSAHADNTNGACRLSETGIGAFMSELERRLTSPKNLNEFNVALAFKGLLSDDEYRRCLAAFKRNLEESIRGNKEKFSHMVQTPFGPLTSLMMSQMLATQAWLDSQLST